MKKFYTIYKTTNINDGKVYYGKHETDVIDDGYIGSGKLLKLAIKKHGKKSFIKEILFIFDNPEDMNNKEKELINENFLIDKNCYNIALGGQGGNLGKSVNIKIGIIMSNINKGKPKSDTHKINLSKSNKGKIRNKNTVEKIKNSTIKRISMLTDEDKKIKFGNKREKNGFYGKNHSFDTIEKIKKSIGDTRKGDKNPNAKSIMIDGVLYTTKKDCMLKLGLNKHKLKKLLENKLC